MALDFGVHNVTIQYGQTGTTHSFAKGVTVTGAIVGAGTLSLLGDTTTPTNCVIAEPTSGPGIATRNLASIKVGGFSVAGKGGFGALDAGLGTQILIIGPMDYAATDSPGGHQYAFGGVIVGSGFPCTISGGAAYHLFAQEAGSRVANLGTVITFTASVTFGTAFANAANLAEISSGSTITLNGKTITGKKFTVSNGAMINTNGSGTSYFPGGTAGTGTNYSVTPWGLYL